MKHIQWLTEIGIPESIQAFWILGAGDHIFVAPETSNVYEIFYDTDSRKPTTSVVG